MPLEAILRSHSFLRRLAQLPEWAISLLCSILEHPRSRSRAGRRILLEALEETLHLVREVFARRNEEGIEDDSGAPLGP